MVDVIGTALSGLQASTERVRVAGNNIANAGSTGGATRAAYTPQDVVSIAEPTGGVQTRLVDRNPATVQAYDPNSPDADANGLIETPNVDMATEIVVMKMAEAAYKANIKVMKVAENMQDELLKTFDEHA